MRRKLTLSDSAMFERVMSNKKICKKMVETILNIELDHIEFHNTEQALTPRLGRKGVRLDAYLKDGKAVYDIEMQSYYIVNLERRFRYYQSAIDTSILSKGEDYRKLPESYIIFICTQDPFGADLPRYDIERTCVEDSRAEIQCGSHWVVLNAQSYQKEANESLRKLLEYIDKGDANSDPFVQNIAAEVEKANEDRKWVNEVFVGLTDMEDAEIRARWLHEEGQKEGLAKGRAEGIKEGEQRHSKLVSCLLKDGRLDDLEKATTDHSFLAGLYKEYNL